VTTTLITGANKGLGFEAARQLAAAGHQVWIGARDHARGRQAADDVGAFIPLLEKSQAPVVVNVSSGVGSLGLAADPDGPWSEANYPVYASSKAALNMLTIRYAAAFPRMRINSVDPGFTATDFNQHRGAQTVEQGAEAIVRYALINGDGPTGGFFDRDSPELW